MNEMRAHFRPEFLNRVDDIVLFKPLTLPEIKRIVDLQLKLLRARLADRHIELELSEAAREHIAREGYDPVYGARPLKRFLQRQVRAAGRLPPTCIEPVKNKLLIVTDLGVLKAYDVVLTPKHTPRLEPLDQVVLEDAHHRVVDKVTDLAGRHVAPTQKNWGAPVTD